MLRLFLFFACFSHALSAASFRIVKGQEGEIKNFPYLAALLHRNVVRCGSAIINKRTVVTATHCFKDVILAKLSVRVGTEYGDRYLKDEGQVVPALHYLTHPNYVALTQNNDVALVWTKEDLVFGPNVQAIPLAASNAPLPLGQVGVASGWGRLKKKGPFPDKFHFALLPILERNKCIKKGGGGYEAFRITNKMFCAGYLAGGSDTCKSDSGGPFVVDNTLVGIVSFGEGCGKPKFPGVYANVAAFRDWIDDNVVLEKAGLLDATEKHQEEYLLKLKNKRRKKLKRNW